MTGKVQVRLVPLEMMRWSFSGKDSAPRAPPSSVVGGNVGSSPTRCILMRDEVHFPEVVVRALKKVL